MERRQMGSQIRLEFCILLDHAKDGGQLYDILRFWHFGGGF